MRETQLRLRDLDDLLLQPLFRKYATHPPRIVHYTSVDTLEAILSSGKLRMTHFRHLNDSTEMRHGRAVADGLLRAEEERGNGTSTFFADCRARFTALDDVSIQYFVTSFSILADAADLWARYGARSSGVAIVFDTLRMGASASEQFPFHIAAVTYTESRQLELLSPLIYGTRQVMASYIRRHGYDAYDRYLITAAAKLCSHLNHHSISLKDRHWRVEREWRAVFSLLVNDSDGRKSRVQFYNDGRPYIDVSVLSVNPEDVRLPITKVTVGAEADIARIRDILDRFGYSHVETCRSQIAAAELPPWPVQPAG